MREKAHSKLWIYFVAIVFAIMLATAVIMALLAFTFFRLGYLTPTNGGNPLAPFMFLLFISVVIGTVISLFVAKKILTPITTISKVSNEVAKGNFDVRLDEISRVTEIRELTQNFNVMIQELSSIETLRDDFVVNVSHEFKTPIAAIEGYAMLLQDKGLSETERDDYTQMILNSSRRLANLSGNILRLSKLESQEVILEKKLYRLDEQIRQAILLLESQWSAKDIDLQIDMIKTTYKGNEKLLMQVWMNIIGNAVKFTPAGGKITVQLSWDKENTVVQISDNGCGMDANVVRHIFDKFYQGDTTRKSEGNGLGLTLAKRIVDLCGGDIRVKSEIGKGSVFMVSLPNDY